MSPLWLLLSLPGYLGLRLVPALVQGPLATTLAFALLFGVCLLIPASVGTRHRSPGTVRDIIAWLGLIALGFFSTLFIATLSRDLVLAIVFLVAPAREAGLVAPSALAVIIVTTCASLIGLWIARRPRLVEVAIPLRDLPRALEGFTIAQISDIHVGPTIKRGFVERIVTRTNALGADVIAVTGDVVDGSVAELATHTAPLGLLGAKHGVYFVTGNHEYYSGEAAWTAEMRRLGLIALKNEHVVLEHGGASIVLAGVDDDGAPRFDPGQRSDAAQALYGAPDSSVKILLAHQPSSALQASQAGFDLQLSGHTHGGQFWPWNLAVRYFQPFTAGLHRLGCLWVYVSRGTGYWGPPNRFGVPGEITRIRLVSA